MAFAARDPTYTITPASLFGAADSADHELLTIHLEYNDLLVSMEAASSGVWQKRAAILHALGRYEEAVEACDHVLATEPHNAEVLFQRGVALQLLALQLAGGVFPETLDQDASVILGEAAECFRQVLAGNPEDAEANQYLVSLRCLLYT